MTTLHIPLPFSPRPWQVPLLDDNAPRITAVVHRRAGKSTAMAWRGLRKALTWQRAHIPAIQRNLKADPPRVIHVLPERVQWGRTGLWDKLTRAAAGIPGAEVFKSELRIVLPNGGVFQAGGMDNPDAWRGGYADEVIEDEADDVGAGGLDMVVVPMLADYNGTRLKVGTPKGNGRLAQSYADAGADPLASRYLLPWQATGVFTPDQVERLRHELTDEEFAQEIECSFSAPNSGSYYGKLLEKAEREGRIGDVSYDPRLPVNTCWDLGMDDSMAVWLFQLTRSGEWRWLEYIEGSGDGFDPYVKALRERDYVYGVHLLPHDVEVRELSLAGRSRKQYLMGLGLKPIRVVPAANPADRVNAVRSILPRSWFAAKGPGIQLGLKRLRGYRRAWNEAMGVWSAQPVHDENSHGSDAFGHGAMGGVEPPDENRRMPRTTAAWDPYTL